MRVPNLHMPQLHLPHGDGQAPLHRFHLPETGLLALGVLIAAALLVGGFAMLANYAYIPESLPQPALIP
ncbi:MAG: hypothetical protein JWO33_1150 [Caulobacteraceae bacterium]|nr:hypothetical protein [Caulobacteraceae bacterium]